MCEGLSDVGILSAPICSNRHKLENSRAEPLAGLFPYLSRLCWHSLLADTRLCSSVCVCAWWFLLYMTPDIAPSSFSLFILLYWGGGCSSSSDPTWPLLTYSRVSLSWAERFLPNMPWITMQQRQSEIDSVLRGYEKWKCADVYISTYIIYHLACFEPAQGTSQ